MSNSLTCSYCGTTACIVRKQSIFKRLEWRGITVKSPICGPCVTKIAAGRMPPNASITEIQIRSMLQVVKNQAANLSRSTKLEDVLSIVGTIKELSAVKTTALAEFNTSANETAKHALKVEWLQSAIKGAEVAIEQKLKVNYEHCRRLANRTIANPELRQQVFSRDGFACRKCGTKDFLSVDHIKPVFRGGLDELDNLQTLCVPCNSRKGATQ